MALDEYQHIIYELYITQNKKQKDVLFHLREHYGLNVTPHALKRKLRSWGHGKNISRPQAFALIRAAAGESDDSIQNGLESREKLLDPARRRQMEMYLRRNRIQSAFTVPRNPVRLYAWALPEQILFSSAELITSSFETHRWISVDNDRIIRSSSNQAHEMKALHAFLGVMATASDAASSVRLDIARESWTQAFQIVDTLLTGQYHDVLPNLLQKINDLKTDGYSAVAKKLQNYLAESSKIHKVQEPLATICQKLRLIHLDDMEEIEERTMQIYVDLFDRFLGLPHYNSFVMHMNLARRLLLRDSKARVKDHIPSLEMFDELFGPTDRRSMDIIRLRTEIDYHRGKYDQVEKQSTMLVDRASRLDVDKWQHLYFLVKGQYFLGLVQTYRGNLNEAESCMSTVAACISEFSKIDENSIFSSDRCILKCS